MTFDEVNSVLMDIGYRLDNRPGSHNTYIKGDSIKTVPTISGKNVAKPYLKEIKGNIERWQGGKNGQSN